MSGENYNIRYALLSNNFLVISRLGLGSFGQALLAKYKKTSSTMLDPDDSKVGTMMEPVCHSASFPEIKPHTNGLVAIKMMKTSLKKPHDYLKVTEVCFIYNTRSHINLLQIHHVFIDSLSGKLCIVMEAMNQNLYQLMQKHGSKVMAPEVVRSMLAQILNAIRHIHAQGYFHRDIKPENILVTPTAQYYGSTENVPPEWASEFYMVKLCDYGLARHYTVNRDLTPYVSTRWYRAPEILLRSRYYTQPIDIWAFACVAVELVNSKPLFPGGNEAEQIWHVLQCLGHPTRVDTEGDAFGGYWGEGVHLAEILGIRLPSSRGSNIHKIVMRPGYSGLKDALRPCFFWNPDARPNVFDLCHHPYFKNSVLEDDPLHYLSSADEASEPLCNSPDSIHPETAYEKSTEVIRSLLGQTGYDLVGLRGPYGIDQDVYAEHMSGVLHQPHPSFDPNLTDSSWVFANASQNTTNGSIKGIEAPVNPSEEHTFGSDSTVSHKLLY